MTENDIHIPAADDYPLAATLYQAEPATGLVVVNPATGVPRQFYRRFARYLAERGLTTVTYDYRGIGESRPPGGLRGFEGRMRDWGAQDLAGVLAWARREHRPDSLGVVAHSVGFQIMGLAPGADDIDRILGVAPPSGYWRLYPARHRYLLALLWYVAGPLVSRVLGYFPSRIIGFGEPLPRGVMGDWARWCRSPGYLFDHIDDETRARYRRMDAPTLVLGFDDDPIAPRASVKALLEHFPSLDVEERWLEPADVAASRLGHFGFFRKEMKDRLWKEAAGWLVDGAGGEADASVL